jgi:transmembrane 9 superfamily protein 1
MARAARLATALLTAAVALAAVRPARAVGASYRDNAVVPVIASKVGPYFNPTETYPYYHLPFCKPTVVEEQSHNLDEILKGERKVMTPFELLFRVPHEYRRLCRKVLSEEDVALLHRAVDEDWYWEMEVDGLPVWGYVGGVQTPTPEYLLKHRDKINSLGDLQSQRYLYTHLIFTVAYNGDSVVAVTVSASASHRLDITELKSLQVDFTYQVKWEASEVPASQRVEHLDKSEALPATFEIHWLSIINSFILVLLLTIFLAIILMRVLKNDFARLGGAAAPEDKEMLYEEDGDAGWKLLHGDVFRFPVNKTLFCAAIGAGTHLILLVLLVLLLAVLSVLSPKRDGLSTVVLVLYALTAGTAGFSSQVLFRRMGGEGWVWTTVLTATLLPGPLLLVFSVLNSIAIYYGSSAALPFGTIVAVFSLYLLVTFPLTVVGAVAGRRSALATQPWGGTTRTNKVARAIPPLPWFRRTLPQMIIAGFLPFSSIYIELHFIFASVWGHRVYSLFGILALAFLLLVVVTAFISIALVYFQLAAEDHRWWWRSLWYGGASSLFVYAYSIFYYYQHSAMSGVLQTSYYFGYMLIVAYCFFLILGTVGFAAASVFVSAIYGALKLD